MSIIILTGGGPKDPPPTNPTPPKGGRIASLSVPERLRAAADQLDAETEGRAHTGTYKVWLGNEVGQHRQDDGA
jgi:hypothetical protein